MIEIDKMGHCFSINGTKCVICHFCLHNDHNIHCNSGPHKHSFKLIKNNTEIYCTKCKVSFDKNDIVIDNKVIDYLTETGWAANESYASFALIIGCKYTDEEYIAKEIIE